MGELKMDKKLNGYYGVVLEVNLTTGQIEKKSISDEDIRDFVGGRGIGMKILWDKLNKPGIDPLSPENPLMFMAGPFTGLPIPSASRTCVVTKSPHTSAINSKHSFASTISYSNMGGFFGPEIRFAGYDGIVVTGKASTPVYIKIDNEKVEIQDADKYWGMSTDQFDKEFIKDLGDRRYRTCYIGPAGENLVSYACIINTAARAAGRGGTGCVMGSKKLKAIAIRGNKMPNVARHEEFLSLLKETREAFKKSESTQWWRYGGTANVLETSSKNGTQAVKNYREGTYTEIDKIGVVASKEKIWIRDFACYCCPLACKKSGTSKAPYEGISHDSPEYESGTMLGANLLISDINGLMKEIYMSDDYGLDVISLGNVIGFLMEAYEKKYVDLEFLDGIDLKWGNVNAILKMTKKIAYREGIGDLASKGVKALAENIGSRHSGTEKFAIHVKGHELAAWNVHANPGTGIGYITSNRGACHMNGSNAVSQNTNVMHDALGICRFASGGFGGNSGLIKFLSAITGTQYTEEDYLKIGERIFNIEKMFNYREGFRREDDQLPDRFFEEPLTIGDKKGAVLEKDEFNKMLNDYYESRGWDPKTSKPENSKLENLGLSFTLET